MATEYEVLAEQIAKLSSELIAVRARLDRIENHYTVDGHPSRSWFTDELASADAAIRDSEEAHKRSMSLVEFSRAADRAMKTAMSFISEIELK